MQQNQLAQEAIAKCFSCGFGFVPPSREPGSLIHVPFSLVPRQLPRAPFELAYALAPEFNSLVDAIARRPEWLISTLKRTGMADPFTGRLLDIFEAVLEEGIRQPLYMGVHRSDYMIDTGTDGLRSPALRQIELNTISAAFAGLSSRLTSVHRYLIQRYGATAPLLQALLARRNGAAPEEGKTAGPTSAVADALPGNESLTAVAAALAAAHGAYGVQGGVVAFVTQPTERNIMDQRLIEHELWDAHGVKSVRITLELMARHAHLRPGDGALLLTASGSATGDADAEAGSVVDEIAVVYYRCGYTPDDYPGESEWDARLLAERSRAIKCPPIAYHLCGTKKVQQALALPGELERFATSLASAAALRGCFAGLWSLDPEDHSGEAAAAMADARLHPDRFVMKPQREGGGNNIYGPKVAAALAGEGSGGLPADALAGYILMERVFPQLAPALFVKSGAVVQAAAVSELGVYGTFLGDGGALGPLVNRAAGHLLRTKAEDTDEGGVATGYAVLDSPCLVAP